MPTYLLHGFRWPRSNIRSHIILQNLDDAAAEWLMAPMTTHTLLENFHQRFPESMVHLPRLRFIEQHDPSDMSAAATSQPFAYVADVAEEVHLSIEIEEVRGRGLKNEQWSALMELRDKLAPGQKVGWYIVVCGDEERAAPPRLEGDATGYSPSPVRASDSSGYSGANGAEQARSVTSTSEPRGLRKLLNAARLGRTKSRTADNDSTPRASSRTSLSRRRITSASRDELNTVPLPTRPGDIDSFMSIPNINGSGDGYNRVTSNIYADGTAAGGPKKGTSSIYANGTIVSGAKSSNTRSQSRVSTNGRVSRASVVSTPQYSTRATTPERSDGESRAKYRRSSVVPDYRAEMDDASTPRSAIPVSSQPVEWQPSLDINVPKPWLATTHSRRGSVSTTRTGTAPTTRGVSPQDQMRRRTVTGGTPEHSARVSPLISPAHSPTSRSSRSRGPSGAISPMGRDLSPASRRGGPPVPVNNRYSAPAIATSAATAARRTAPRPAAPSLPSAPPAADSGKNDDDDDTAEVITLSPSVRGPMTRHRQSRASSIYNVPNDGSSVTLGRQRSRTASVVGDRSRDADDGGGKPYFGQAISSSDLLAHNLDTVFAGFDRLA